MTNLGTHVARDVIITCEEGQVRNPKLHIGL